MKFGRFQHQSRTFFGIVDGNQVVELDGSPFDRYKVTSNLHALSALKILTPCEMSETFLARMTPRI